MTAAAVMARPRSVTIPAVLAWMAVAIYALQGTYLLVVVWRQFPGAGSPILAAAIPNFGLALLVGLGAWGLQRGALLGRLWLSFALVVMTALAFWQGGEASMVLAVLTVAVVVPVWLTSSARLWFEKRNPGFPGGVRGIAQTVVHARELVAPAAAVGVAARPSRRRGRTS